MGRTVRVWQLGLVSVGLLGLSGSVGCQPNETTTSSSTAGTGGTGGSVGGTGGSTGGTGGSTGGAGGSTGGTSAGGTGGTGGSLGPCLDGAQAATIYDVTDPASPGAVGKDIKVKIDGVIAMSKKHLISYSTANSNCLWGVFVSAPKTAEGQQLTETAANSGALVLSKGNLGIANKAACYTDPNAKGDAIPDDVKPGDVLDVVATTDSFLLDFIANNPCGTKATDTDIPTLQLSDACQAKKNGTAAVPAPHEFSADEIAALAAQHKADAGAEDFHRSWGNVKLRVGNWSPALSQQGTVTGPFGIIKIAPSQAEIHDGLYYKNGSSLACEVAPMFTDTSVMFNYVQGFHYLDFCTWAISNTDKCADFSPQSEDCKSQAIAACVE